MYVFSHDGDDGNRGHEFLHGRAVLVLDEEFVF